MSAENISYDLKRFAGIKRDYEGMELENGDIYDGDLSEGLFLAGGNIGWMADSIDNGFWRCYASLCWPC